MEKYYDDAVPKEEEYLYLLLYAKGAGGSHNDPVRAETFLQKIMHSVSEVIGDPVYDFRPYAYGVFSDTLASVLEQGIKSNIIQKNGAAICLSSQGMASVKAMWEKSDQRIKDAMIRIKKFYGQMNYNECIAYSYSQYPNMTTESSIMKKFQKTRKSSAISLFRKKLVSLNMAASIAGITPDGLVRLLNKRGISPYYMSEESYENAKKTIKDIL